MEEELFREQELNRLARERVGINSEVAARVTETNNVLLDQLKNLKFQGEESRKISASLREVGRIIKRNQSLSLQDLADKKKVKKVTEDLNRLTSVNTYLTTQQMDFSEMEGELQQEISRELGKQITESAALANELKTVSEISETIAGNFAVQRFKGIADFIKSVPGLRTFAVPFEEASDAIVEAGIGAEKQKREIFESLKFATGLTKVKLKELGVSEIIGDVAGTAARDRAKEPEVIEKINKKFSAGAAVQKESLNILNKIGKGAVGTVLLRNILAVDTAQAEFNRELGRSIDGFATVNKGLTSTVDFIRTATSLTQQFGFAADAVFDRENLVAATEMMTLMGMSAEQAGRFALFSQTTGTNLDDNLETIVDQVGEINVINKSAVTQRRIFEDISNTSSAIALTFQGNTVQLARASQQARILGITLQQVDNIAAGLLDIESSIASEFEAEVISGKQLNLERARLFALTNDLDGLTKELASNQEAINAFATGNRIEQEAIAGALGMSRDEMADMIFQQRAQLNITDEQAAATLGLNKLDFQRLSAQESLAKSIEKIGSTLAIVVAPILKSIADNAFIISGIFSSLATLSLLSLVNQLSKMALSVGLIAGMTPAGAIAALAGITAISFAVGAALTKAGDAVIPAGKGPIISTREGGLIQGTANDDVIMAPGIARGGRNAGLSKSDVAAIAKAVRDGASQAQINLDGGSVSNRLQPSLAVNTRKYSI